MRSAPKVPAAYRGPRFPAYATFGSRSANRLGGIRRVGLTL